MALNDVNGYEYYGKAFNEMGTENNNNDKGQNRRASARRSLDDRREEVRFEDVLGRRAGVERRVTPDRSEKSKDSARS